MPSSIFEPSGHSDLGVVVEKCQKSSANQRTWLHSLQCWPDVSSALLVVQKNRYYHLSWSLPSKVEIYLASSAKSKLLACGGSQGPLLADKRGLVHENVSYSRIQSRRCLHDVSTNETIHISGCSCRGVDTLKDPVLIKFRLFSDLRAQEVIAVDRVLQVSVDLLNQEHEGLCLCWGVQKLHPCFRETNRGHDA